MMPLLRTARMNFTWSANARVSLERQPATGSAQKKSFAAGAWLQTYRQKKARASAARAFYACGMYFYSYGVVVPLPVPWEPVSLLPFLLPFLPFLFVEPVSEPLPDP